MNSSLCECIYQNCPVGCIDPSGEWYCNFNECLHKDLSPFNTTDVYLIIILFFVNIVTTISGAGGGGIIIPILILLGNFGTDYSIPLSSIMITGSCLARVIFFFNKKHPQPPTRYMINWDSIMVMTPFIAASSYLGILINDYSPKYIILSLLIFFQVVACISAVYYEKNSVNTNEEIHVNNTSETPLRHWLNMIIYIINIAIFIAVTLIQQLYQNSNTYNIIKSIFFLINGIIVVVIIRKIFLNKKSRNYNFSSSDLSWDAGMFAKFIGVSCCVGIVSSFLGLGGGILINPFFIAIGMSPLIASYTSPYITFYSSLISSIQYIFIKKQVLPYYGILFFLEAIGGTLIGIYIIQKLKEFRIIILLLIFIMITSIVLLVIIFVKDI
ncbi:MAG: hypothetical protein Harvfovirus45_5 [Harvfovirus sp.]|uniref:Sulfite exporter TauE/SafE n=1 Tax=Harvfovirus sp. TaxID=2487768 RepID=A0A3G5A316_9VIRU|nr:MAG: hypothetical protein Harvfovirus45_5 [Harvfovirus sp.]